MNKRAIAIDFMAGFIFIGLIIILGFILSFIVSSHGDKKEQEFNTHRALLETKYQTRTVLTQQYGDQQIYQQMLDDYNTHGVETAIENANRVLTENNPGTTWYIYINGHTNVDSRDLRNLDVILPELLVPNSKGTDLRVKIKILKEEDFDLKPLRR